MKKKVLVVGTSHSFAECRRYKNPMDTGNKGAKDPPSKISAQYRNSKFGRNITAHPEEGRLTTGRWHDYFKTEYDMEVTNLAQPGATPTVQLAGLLIYLDQNPNERWDIAVLEGRRTELSYALATKDIPSKRKIKSNEVYDDMIPYFKNSILSGMLPKQTVGKYVGFFGKRLMHHYMVKNFVGSPLQSVLTYGINRAILELMKTRANHVGYWTLRLPLDTPDQYMKFENQWFDTLLDDYAISRNIKEINNFQGTECGCGHPNLKGHKIIWEKYVKKYFEDVL